MKFYKLSEIPPRSDDQVFKASPTGPFIGFIVYSGIGIVLLLFGISGAKIYGLSLGLRLTIKTPAAEIS